MAQETIRIEPVPLAQALTVEAWVQVGEPLGEGPLTLVSQGSALQGAFSLRYLDTADEAGPSAPPGPAFAINTDRGAYRVAADGPLPPGSHHVAGTYDGCRLKLFVDGERVAQCDADGRIVCCDTPIAVAKIRDAQGRSRGRVPAANVLDVALTDSEIKAIALGHMQESREQISLRLEMDTYFVLDDRQSLTGNLFVPPQVRKVRLTATQHDGGAIGWQTGLDIEPTSAPTEHPIAIPVASMRGGYYQLTAQSDTGDRTTVTLALRDVRPALPGARCDYLAFARSAVDRIVAEQTRHLHDDPKGAAFITVTRPVVLGYRSLGYKTGDTYATCWFPQCPFEYETFRADYELWPILDQLSQLTGESAYAERVTGMIGAIAEHGFDPRSGLMYLSQECDFDVRTAEPRRKGPGHAPRFKPLNTGNYPQLHLERMWRRMPGELHRCFRAIFFGLVTDPVSFDYNRFCSYGFDDAQAVPAQTRNSGHCAFDTAAGRMIHWWCSCWRHTGDDQCLDWAQRMADKWAAVQHRDSGLVPNFFGAAAWAPGTPQPPGEWCESRGAALTALSLMQAALELRHREGAEPLAAQLCDMSRQMALGVARWSYDDQRRVFREHLHLDGRPWSGTARYCFATEAQKKQAVENNPEMAQVPVYDGAGFYRNPNYYEVCAGTDVPWHIACAAALDGDRDRALVEHLRRMTDDAVEEAQKIDSAFTPEGRWTFRASAQYIKLCLVVAQMTEDRSYVDMARQLADREIHALASVHCPDWWRLPERSSLLDAMLMLHGEA